MKQAIYSLCVRYRTVRTLVCTEYLNERSWAAPKYIRSYVPHHGNTTS